MTRWRHHRRDGEDDADSRDLQVNGSARAHGPWRGVHESFADPVIVTTPGSLTGYTGFAADGYWYEAGRRVTSSPGELLSHAVHDFNTLKWTKVTSTMPHAQDADGLDVNPVGGGDSILLVRSRFELRGDFHVRLRVQASTMTGGDDDELGTDNAVFFGLRSVTTTANYWRVKHTRNVTLDNDDGFAAEVNGLGAQIGHNANIIPSPGAYDLVAIRTAGVLHLHFVDGDGDTFEVWSGAAAGRMHVEFGAQNTGAASWTARLAEYVHVTGWHDYSSRASWASERANGTLLEQFVGDELDARIWTAETSGNGTVECGAEGNGRGLRLNVALGGQAAVRSVTLTGDWTLRTTMRTTRAAGYIQGVGDVETLAGVDVLADAGGSNLPHVRLALIGTVVDGAGLVPNEFVVLPLIFYDDGLGGGDVLVGTGTGLDYDPAAAIRIERRGRVLIVEVDDANTGARVLTATLPSSALPSAPLAVRLRSEGVESAADWIVRIPSAHFTSPHALTTEAWPTDYYGAGALGLDDEVTRYPFNAVPTPYPDLTQLTMIDLESRSPLWRIVGVGDGAGVSGLQALPGGAVGDVFADPDAGRLVIPIASAAPTTDGGFVIVDLRTDRLYLRRGADAWEFNGPVGWRHLGMNKTVYTGFTGDSAPGAGTALGYAEVTHGTDLYAAWTLAEGVQLVKGAVRAWIMHNDDDVTYGTTLVHRSVLLPVNTGGKVQLVVLCERRDDVAVAVYRDLGASMALGDETAPGEDAAAIYTGTAPDVLNVGFIDSKIPGAADGADDDGHVDLHAIVGTLGLPLFAVARMGEGGGVTQDNTVPATATFYQWPSAIVPDVDGSELSAGPRAVRLTADANIVGTRAGSVVFGEGDVIEILEIPFLRGAIEVVGLSALRVRSTIIPNTVAGDVEFPDDSDPAFTSGGLILISPPPGVLAGVRIAAGLGDDDVGVFEYDETTVIGGPWGGPHIGGTRFELEGWGLDDVVQVFVGGIDCFRLTRDLRGETPKLSVVNRALGWIEHPEAESPVMSDAELEATAEWPHDVLLRWKDGTELTVVGGFVYESVLCIEHTLARIIGRLNPEILDNDPKSNWPQRHVFVALAFLLCRHHDDFLTPLEADTYVDDATGEALRHLAGSYGAAVPYESMPDARVRTWITQRMAGNRVTPMAILDLLESVLGVRPTMTESYREFTIHVSALPADGALAARGFWSDTEDADPATGGYFDRDFWGGPDPRIAAARRVLDFCRAAGVRANLVLEEAP